MPYDFPASERDAALAASAVTSINLQDTDGADRFLHALENLPVTAEIAAARGNSALVRSSFQTAFRAFDAALAIDPNSLRAAWGLAESDRRFGNNEKARKEFQSILQRDPKNLLALQSLKQLDMDFSRWPEAEDLQRRLIAASPQAGAAECATLGEILFRAGNLEQAYDTMQACLKLDPYNFQTRLNLGKLLSSEKEWAEARQHLEFVKRYFPDDDAGVYSLLFQIDNALGDPRAAAEAVRFGLRMFPDNSDLRRLKLML